MYVHGDNLEQKETHKTKYNDQLAERYLSEIRQKYDKWRADNASLVGPKKSANGAADVAIIKERVRLLNEYKDFLDQQVYAEYFDSRSNLHSSVLEEFMYYLFRDLVADISPNSQIGKTHAFKDIFFRSANYGDMVGHPNALIEIKDHDFAIGSRISATMKAKGSSDVEHHEWDIPAVAIECKTYLDKTMLKDAVTEAEQLKHRNPNALYIVVSEWLKLTESVNLKKFKIDQIYVLRKQKNTDREFRYDAGYVKNPIYDDVAIHLFDTVRNFLTSDWEGGISHGITKGYLI